MQQMVEIQDELTSQGTTLSFKNCIQLSITLDNAVRERHCLRTHLEAMSAACSPTDDCTEPMQPGHSPLTMVERHCCTNMNSACTVGSWATLSQKSVKVGISALVGVFQVQLTVPIVITYGGEQITTRALLDSGAAGNFMDLTIA